MKQRHYRSTIEKVKMIRSITQRYYEPGNHQRSYKAVWRRYINPIYPMSYGTYLRYLGIAAPPQPKPSSMQLCLFDFFDGKEARK